MSKAVLVMEMPECCADCKAYDNDNEMCMGTDDYYMETLAPTDKPDWCPLKPMPERDDREYFSDFARGYKLGWNNAIKAIDPEGYKLED